MSDKYTDASKMLKRIREPDANYALLTGYSEEYKKEFNMMVDVAAEAIEKQTHMCGNCNIWHPEIGWCEERDAYTDEDMQCPDWSEYK